MQERRSHNLPRLLLGDREAAYVMGVSRTTFRALDSSGILGPAGIRLGRRRLWRLTDIEAWINAEMPRRERWESRT